MTAFLSTVAYGASELQAVEVSCEIVDGHPTIEIFGLPGSIVDECRRCIHAALASAALSLPRKRIIISLHPLDRPKEGLHFGLPMALALLSAIGVVDGKQLADWIAVGELAADGSLGASPDFQAVAAHTRQVGKGLIWPVVAPAITDVPVLIVANLVDAVRQLKQAQDPKRQNQESVVRERTVPERRVDEHPPGDNGGLLSKALSMLRRGANISSPAPAIVYHQQIEPDPGQSAAFVREARPQFDLENANAWRNDLPAPERGFGSAATRREPDPDFHGNGHRSRLRARLIEGGADGLADYEVLEFLLFGARQRGDTKPLAKALIKRFGSLAAVLNADPAALMQVQGIGPASVGVIRIAAVAAKRMARLEVREQPMLGNYQALRDYLMIDMAHLTRERVRVLYLDRQNRLIKDEHLSEGTLDEASVHPREVIHHALNVGAGALIMVHNHPSGSPEPSQADIQITNRIAEAGRLMGVVVHDHFIVGRAGIVSLRERGLV